MISASSNGSTSAPTCSNIHLNTSSPTSGRSAIALRRSNDFVYARCATYRDPPDAVREQMRTITRQVGRQLEAEVQFRDGGDFVRCRYQSPAVPRVPPELS